MKTSQKPAELRKLIFWLRTLVFSYVGLVFFYIAFAYAHGFNDVITHNGTKTPSILVMLISFTVMLAIMGVTFWLFYKLYTKLIYKNILKLFKINYDDLLKLEQKKE